MADPQYPLNCPRCPLRLEYLYTPGTDASSTRHVYRCEVHGSFLLTPDGRLREWTAKDLEDAGGAMLLDPPTFE